MADLASFIMIILPVILYFSLCEGLKGQATWGKRKLGLRVVDQDGSRIGLGRSFLRTIVKFIAWEPAHFVIFRFVFHSHVPEFYLDGILILIYLLIFVYLISPFLNKRKRALYDWVAGTVVLSDPKPSVQ
ncbi:MAG TPA: RDD family protein [Bacillales bacterium]|nr:RDD family protein [Bacillales bacterium]